MKRFDDFLKLLLGLLVTQIIRDHHQITVRLAQVFEDAADWSAELFPYAVLLLFLRNTHASIIWDRVTDKAGFHTWLDETVFGRGLVFLVGVVTHVVVPLVIIDVLTEHTGTQGGRTALVLALFVPFGLYFFWDLFLFVVSENQEGEIPKVICDWLWVDAVAVVMMLGLLIRYSYVSFGSAASQYLYLLEGFMVVSVGTVIVDYWRNRHFYFRAV